MKICSVDGCGKDSHALGFCNGHFSKFRRYKDPLGKPVERPMKLSGGKRIPGHGEGIHIRKAGTRSYRVILCPCHKNADSKGYVLEHRLVIEVHLSRYLDDHENVHHKDGNGLNNQIDNLQIVTKSEHSKIHKYWETSPRIGNTWCQKEYNLGNCKNEGCTEKASAQGLCANHYKKLWMYGDANYIGHTGIDSNVEVNKNMPQHHFGRCSITGCTGRYGSKGFCVKHYQKFMKYGDPLAIAPLEEAKRCSVDGCNKKYHGKGYCSSHLYNFTRYSDPNPIYKQPAKRKPKNGGRYIKQDSKHKYWKIKCPCNRNADKDGFVLEHRLAMEVHLGRYLEKSELVAHINGDTLDNSIDNLKLTTRSESGRLNNLGNTRGQRDYNLGPCKTEGCANKAKTIGHCLKHYSQIFYKRKIDLLNSANLSQQPFLGVIQNV